MTKTRMTGRVLALLGGLSLVAGLSAATAPNAMAGNPPSGVWQHSVVGESCTFGLFCSKEHTTSNFTYPSGYHRSTACEKTDCTSASTYSSYTWTYATSPTRPSDWTGYAYWATQP